MTLQTILLAAGRGSRLGIRTENMPKSLVQLAGKPLLNWLCKAHAEAAITKLNLITGYRANCFDPIFTGNKIHNQFGIIATCSIRYLWLMKY